MTADSFSNPTSLASLLDRGASSSAGHPRGRGAYVQQACSVCRHKKTRCDGQKPVCAACIASKRSDECSWTKDATPLRKNRNEAFFEALKKHNDALKEYTSYLESLLEKCRRDHGDSSFDYSYIQRRPLEDDNMDVSFEDFDPTNYGGLSEHDDFDTDARSGSIQGLIAPIQRLTLEGGSLMTFGSTSVFRFRPVTINNAPSRFPAIAENPDATYILLVDGVNESHYNPDFDWARYLPSAVPLDRRAHDRALDLLFKFLTSWCLRVVPALFLRDMYRALSVPRSQAPPKTPHYSPMLHNALVALGAAFLDEPAIRDYKARQYFANEAKSYIDTECSKPNLCSVNALSILATFYSSQGDQTLGFMYFGMSARMSQALGLDVDCSDWVKLGLIEEPDVLDRYWTYWTTFAQDVNWSLYVGRDFCVRAPSENEFRDMPIPFVDSEFDQMPFHHPPSGIPPQPNSLSKTFASTCELLMIARRIMNVVNGISKTRVRASVIDEMISDIDLQLNTWKGSLSPEVDLTPKSRLTATPHKLMLHMAYWWLFILLHRPYFHRKSKVIHSSDKEIDHVKLCKRAAEYIMELLSIWRQLYSLRYVPITLVQPLFAAGTIYLLSGVQATSGIRVAQKELKHSVDSLKLCIQYLREVGKSWQCAVNIESILRSLIEDQLKPAMEKRKIPAKAHLRSTSDGDRIYMTNPPARRQSASKKSRSRQPTHPPVTAPRSDSGDSASSLNSPKIAVHPAPDDALSVGIPGQSFSNPLPPTTGFLMPWGSQGASPGSQPIPITARRRSNSPGSCSSSPTSSPIAIKIPPSPSTNALHLTVSPNPSNPSQYRDPSPPPSSFPTGSPLSLMNGSFSQDQDSLFGMLTSLDVGEGHGNYDYTNFEMSRFFAMLGGQHLPDVPFVGPFTIEESIGSMQQPADSSEFDMSIFGRVDLTGDSSTAAGLNGFYPLLDGSPPVSTSAYHRRSVSENFTPVNGNGAVDMFDDLDFA